MLTWSLALLAGTSRAGGPVATGLAKLIQTSAAFLFLPT